MAQHVNAQLLLEHLRKRTTFQLCDDYGVMSKGDADWHLFAARMISDLLFERNESAWWEWMTAGNLFGTPDPHKYFAPK
jgi:hypothetical protein